MSQFSCLATVHLMGTSGAFNVIKVMGILLGTSPYTNVMLFNGCFPFTIGANFRMMKQSVYMWTKVIIGVENSWKIMFEPIWTFETPGKIQTLMTSYSGNSSPFIVKRLMTNSCTVPLTCTGTLMLVHHLFLPLVLMESSKPKTVHSGTEATSIGFLILICCSSLKIWGKILEPWSHDHVATP